MRPLMPSVPHAIIMVGIPGAGKSTFSLRFADTFSTPLFNLPKLKADMELDARQTAQFFEVVMQEVSKTGQTIVVEGFSDTKKERESLEKVFTRLKYKPLFVWVQTDTNESLRRATSARMGDERLSESEFDDMVEAFEPPEMKEGAVVISGRHAYPTQLKVVLKQMALNATRPKEKPSSPVNRQVRPRGRTVTVSTVKNIQKR